MLGAKVMARAKINLFLEVGARRADGYHDIRSVMQALDLSDELYFRRTDGSAGRIVIRCNDTCVPSTAENLVWKSIEEFDSRTSVIAGGGIDVLINKRIPVGAGLAGGSADAAATFLALDHMFELDIPPDELADMGAAVGSDVPFCLLGGTALVSGRGERVERLEPMPRVQVVLASPGEEASTKVVYDRFDALEPAAGSPAEMEVAFNKLIAGISTHDFDSICSSLRNSLEPATTAPEQVERYKEIARQAGALVAMMAGSGPTVFALVSGMEEAAEVAWELEKAAPITIVTSFTGRGAELSKV
ncbi:MAG TPA: 4-(cytidine 5'-diphospho)-2-C-methyl-D-erythritol kinase [Candidatus Anoxymicrobiaceae bacterium]